MDTQSDVPLKLLMTLDVKADLQILHCPANGKITPTKTYSEEKVPLIQANHAISDVAPTINGM